MAIRLVLESDGASHHFWGPANSGAGPVRTVGRWWRGASLWLAGTEWVPPKWYQRVGLVLLLAGIIGRILAPALWPQIYWAIHAGVINRSFGPDWHCGYTPRAAQVCFRAAQPDP